MVSKGSDGEWNLAWIFGGHHELPLDNGMTSERNPMVLERFFELGGHHIDTRHSRCVFLTLLGPEPDRTIWNRFFLLHLMASVCCPPLCPRPYSEWAFCYMYPYELPQTVLTDTLQNSYTPR